MFLSNLSIKHPVFATMMMAALAVIGVASYSQLKVDMFPKVEIPVVTVTTVYPGAGPETVEREVTKRVEEEINTVEGVRHIESVSQEGLSNIVVEFNLEVTRGRPPPRTCAARSPPSAASYRARSRSRSSSASTSAPCP